MPFFLDSASHRAAPASDDFTCSGEMNSPCAEVLLAAKHSYGAKAPPHRVGPWTVCDLESVQTYQKQKRRQTAILAVCLQFVEKPFLEETSRSPGRGARGGGSPPRMGSNVPQALPGKACGEQSEDLRAAARPEGNGIFEAVEKVWKDFFDSLKGPLPLGRGPLFLKRAINSAH